MTVFVDGRRVITNAPGAIVKAKSKNFVNSKKNSVKTYDSICKSEDLVNCCKDVRIDGYPIATIDSFFTRSYGDEGGTGGGVKSGTINGSGRFITASKTTFVSSMDGTIVNVPVVREGDLVVSNCGNCEPAPIEFLPAYQIDNPCKPDGPIKCKEESNYHSRIVLHTGSLDSFTSQVLVSNMCVAESELYQWLPINYQQQSEQQATSQRLVLVNSPNKKLKHQLIVHQLFGGFIEIPLLTSEFQASDDDSSKIEHQDEDEQLVSLRLVESYQLPKEWSVDSVHLSDIFRLSAGLRQRIYSFLINYELTKSGALFDDVNETSIQYSKFVENPQQTPLLKNFINNWYQILPGSLKIMVDLELNKKVVRTLDDGWLYIFVNGHLWREIAIKRGFLYEVNLKELFATEDRMAKGFAEEKLIVPYKNKGKVNKVEVAFSEQQWSWPRINYYGGFSEHESETRRPPNVQQGGVGAKYDKRRAERFISLNLAALIDDNQTQVLDELGLVQLYFLSKIYHLVIPNILRPIEQAARDIAKLRLDLLDYVAEMQNPLNTKNFNTAATIYHYFYYPESGWHAKNKNNADINHEKYNNMLAKQSYDMSPRLYQAAKIARPQPNTDLEEAALQLDLDAIKAALKVDKRRRMRDLIRELQKSLVGLVQANESMVVSATNASLIKERHFDWHRVLYDWFASDMTSYAHAYGVVNLITSSVLYEPSDLDREFDIKDEDDHHTLGQSYILTTLEEAHPLFKVLHPTAQALEQAKAKTEIEEYHNEEYIFANYNWAGEHTFNQTIYSFLWTEQFHNVTDLFKSSIKGY